jgi:hypothetical protein
MKKILLILITLAFASSIYAQNFSSAFNELDGKKEVKSTDKINNVTNQKNNLNLVEQNKLFPKNLPTLNSVINSSPNVNSPVPTETTNSVSPAKNITFLSPIVRNGVFGFKNNGQWKVGYTDYYYNLGLFASFSNNYNKRYLAPMKFSIINLKNKAYEVCKNSNIKYLSSTNSVIVLPVVENIKIEIKEKIQRGYKTYYSGDITCYYVETE